MTWVWGILIWVTASVLLGILTGILLGIRRELEDVGHELNLILHRTEEIQQGIAEIRLKTQDLMVFTETEMEHVGTVAMETTPASAIVREKPDEHKWKRGRIGQEDEP